MIKSLTEGRQCKVETCGGTSLFGGLALFWAMKVFPSISSCLPDHDILLSIRALGKF